MRHVQNMVLAGLAVGSLSACATNIPETIRAPPPDDVTVAEARRDPNAYVGRRVRWGGTIAGVENGKTETLLEVVARDLEGNGRPRLTDRSPGRFLARAEGFLDPAVYRNGREVTVTGTLDAPITRKIGEYTYRYPVVKTDMVYLWEPHEEPRCTAGKRNDPDASTPRRIAGLVDQ